MPIAKVALISDGPRNGKASSVSVKRETTGSRKRR